MEPAQSTSISERHSKLALFAKDAIKTLRNRGYHGSAKACEILSIPFTPQSWHAENAVEAEALKHLIVKASEHNINGSLKDLIYEACVLTRSIPREALPYERYSNIASELLSRYGTLLKAPGNEAAANILLGGVVEEALEQNNSHALIEISHDLLSTTMQRISSADLLRPFSFMPEAFAKDPRIVATLQKSEKIYARIYADLIRASSPLDFFKGIAEQHYNLRNWFEPRPAQEIFASISDQISPRALIVGRHLLNGRDGEAALLNELRDRGTGSVMCDVDGTLRFHDFHNRKYVLHQARMEKLAELSNSGVEVVIATGGIPEDATRALRQLGVPRDLSYVRAKDRIRRTTFDIAIDDTSPWEQRITATLWIASGSLTRHELDHNPSYSDPM